MARVERSLPVAIWSNSAAWLLCAVPLLVARELPPDGNELTVTLLYMGAAVLPVLAFGGAVIFNLPTPTEQAQRAVYEEFAGDMDLRRSAGLAPLRRLLLERLRERILGLSVEGYRSAPVVEEWATLALDERVSDAPLLRAALTLARVEETLAARGGKDRRRWHRLHQDVWRRLAATCNP